MARKKETEAEAEADDPARLHEMTLMAQKQRKAFVKQDGKTAGDGDVTTRL
ncbi:MAG: hypothetical protein ACRYHA_22015 [Janthinobacterium lividum]